MVRSRLILPVLAFLQAALARAAGLENGLKNRLLQLIKITHTESLLVKQVEGAKQDGVTRVDPRMQPREVPVENLLLKFQEKVLLSRQPAGLVAKLLPQIILMTLTGYPPGTRKNMVMEVMVELAMKMEKTEKTVM
ncbi:MAG: hypothetical protein JXB88_22625 [Spirochaetales bacterium]|nr:hypothetical protein [Spirochaetales bacterium]